MDKNGHDLFGGLFDFLGSIFGGLEISGGFGGSDDLTFGAGAGTSFGGDSFSGSSVASSIIAGVTGNSAGASFGGAPWSPPWSQRTPRDFLLDYAVRPALWLLGPGDSSFVGYSSSASLSAVVTGIGATLTAGPSGLTPYWDVYKGLGTPGPGASGAAVFRWPWLSSGGINDVVPGSSYLVQAGSPLVFWNSTGYGIGVGSPGFFAGQVYSTEASPYGPGGAGVAEFLSPPTPQGYARSDLFPGVYYRWY